MSKRNTASRRRVYGRRQHELHERIDRLTERRRAGRAWRTAHGLALESMGYLDSTGNEQPFGFSD